MGKGEPLVDSNAEIPGIRKAAILLLTMDEELSKEVIKDLEEEDIEAVGQEIAKLRLIPHDVVTKVHDEFVKKSRRKETERRRRRDQVQDAHRKEPGQRKGRIVPRQHGVEEGHAR